MKITEYNIIEFLMTYGWEILVVSILIGALLYFNPFPKVTEIPQKVWNETEDDIDFVTHIKDSNLPPCDKNKIRQEVRCSCVDKGCALYCFKCVNKTHINGTVNTNVVHINVSDLSVGNATYLQKIYSMFTIDCSEPSYFKNRTVDVVLWNESDKNTYTKTIGFVKLCTILEEGK